MMSVGQDSKTDVAVFYLEDKVDKKFLERLKKEIESIKVDSLALSQESLAECLVKKKWYNIFPKFRYTERPDSAKCRSTQRRRWTPV